LVTTRKGKAGTAQINYSVTGGVQVVSQLPQFVGAVDWLTLMNENSMHNITNPTITFPQTLIDHIKTER